MKNLVFFYNVQDLITLLPLIHLPGPINLISQLFPNTKTTQIFFFPFSFMKITQDECPVTPPPPLAPSRSRSTGGVEEMIAFQSMQIYFDKFRSLFSQCFHHQHIYWVCQFFDDILILRALPPNFKSSPIVGSYPPPRGSPVRVVSRGWTDIKQTTFSLNLCMLNLFSPFSKAAFSALF